MEKFEENGFFTLGRDGLPLNPKEEDLLRF